jgi:hypothetical protein
MVRQSLICEVADLYLGLQFFLICDLRSSYAGQL